jgi:hypothetical protein
MKLAFIIALVLFSNYAYAQVATQPGEVKINTYSGANVEAFSKLEPVKIDRNSIFYSDYWNMGTIMLKENKSIAEVLIKYNLYNKSLEVKIENDVKVVPLSLLRSFTWINSKTGIEESFVNTETLSEVSYLNSILQVLVSGKTTLYKENGYKILQPNYNVQFDVGERDEKLVEEQNYYLAMNDSIYDVKLKKKFIKKLFLNNQEALNLINSNRYKIKSEDDLVSFVADLNALSE